mmetsp:Transcript_61291/g.193060  ORF Transcript_61291/g.193060 Transcript_61291/m.193060 type:complete len:345 (+) Transcript_61291:596-1630(+)
MPVCGRVRLNNRLRRRHRHGYRYPRSGAPLHARLRRRNLRRRHGHGHRYPRSGVPLRGRLRWRSLRLLHEGLYAPVHGVAQDWTQLLHDHGHGIWRLTSWRTTLTSLESEGAAQEVCRRSRGPCGAGADVGGRSRGGIAGTRRRASGRCLPASALVLAQQLHELGLLRAAVEEHAQLRQAVLELRHRHPARGARLVAADGGARLGAAAVRSANVCARGVRGGAAPHGPAGAWGGRACAGTCLRQASRSGRRSRSSRALGARFLPVRTGREQQHCPLAREAKLLQARGIPKISPLVEETLRPGRHPGLLSDQALELRDSRAGGSLAAAKLQLKPLRRVAADALHR